MKINKMALCILLLALSSCCCAQVITVEQAKDSIKSFESNPNIEFGIVEFFEEVTRPLWDNRSGYIIYTADMNTAYKSWRVNAVTSEVTSADYGEAYPSDEARTDEPFGPLTEEECLKAAETFARAKYSNFKNLNVPPVGEWMCSGWRFIWHQTADYGAGIPNYVEIEVNPADGRIQSYTSSYVPAFTVAQPQLTAQQALEIAMASSGITTLFWSDNPGLVADPDKTSWIVELEGDDADGERRHNLVEINAVTGDVIENASADIDSGSSLLAKQKQMKVEASSKAKNSALVPAKSVIKQIPGAYIKWLGKPGAALTIKGQTFTLKPGSKKVTSASGTFMLSQSIVLEDGRLLVPQDFLVKLRSATMDKQPK